MWPVADLLNQGSLDLKVAVARSIGTTWSIRSRPAVAMLPQSVSMASAILESLRLKRPQPGQEV